MKNILLGICILFNLNFCNAQMNIDVSIDKAINYFAMQYSNIERQDVIVILSILNEHFYMHSKGIDSNKSLVTVQNKYPFYLYGIGRKVLNIEEVNGYKRSLTYFANNNVTDSLYYYMNVITIISMHYEYFVEDTNDLIKSLDKMNNKNSYLLTHAFFQVANLQKCTISCSFDSKLNDILQRLLAKMLTLKENSNPTLNLMITNDADIYYETIAFFLYSKYNSKVLESDIENILKFQNEDGGWSNSTKYLTKSNHHASLLALWSLFQYKNINHEK